MFNKKVYWLCQLGGWLGMVGIETINYTFFIVGKFSISVVLWMLLYAAIGILSTHVYRLLLKKTAFFQKKAVSIWLIAFLSTILLSCILSLANFIPAMVENSAAFWKSVRFIDIAGTIINWSRYVGVWVIIYFMYHLLALNSIIQKEKLQMENLAKTTELELLKTQLNPHFLFNALNSIKALVTINPEQSREAIVKLSELLRFTLQYGKERLIPLFDEITEVKKYLELEQLRFGKRLEVVYDIAENTYSQAIPPAMLLTLAENAVKHGVTSAPTAAMISIQSGISDNKLCIIVRNTGIFEPKSNTGIGLRHIERRLEEVYHGHAQFSISQYENEVTATIQTPLSWQ